MRSQFATASGRNVRFRPYAFTEHGAVVLASVLNRPHGPPDIPEEGRDVGGFLGAD